MGAAGTVTGHKRVLELRLAQGSIVEADARALVLGIFCNVDPAGAAAVVDRSLGGAIREFTLRRMFLGQLGQVFVMPATRSPLRAEFVLFAGLGDFDAFGPIAQAFVAENVVRTFARTHVDDFATVLLGAGSGIPVESVVEHQLQGFLAGLRHADPDHVVRRITLCEIDRRKFTAMRRSAMRLAAGPAERDFDIVIDEVVLPSATAARPMPRRPARRAAAAAPADPAYLLDRVARGGRRRLREPLLAADGRCEGRRPDRNGTFSETRVVAPPRAGRGRHAGSAGHGALRRGAGPPAARHKRARRTRGDGRSPAGGGARSRGVARALGSTARRQSSTRRSRRA